MDRQDFEALAQALAMALVTGGGGIEVTPTTPGGSLAQGFRVRLVAEFEPEEEDVVEVDAPAGAPDPVSVTFEGKSLMVIPEIDAKGNAYLAANTLYRTFEVDDDSTLFRLVNGPERAEKISRGGSLIYLYDGDAFAARVVT